MDFPFRRLKFRQNRLKRVLSSSGFPSSYDLLLRPKTGLTSLLPGNLKATSI